MATKNILVCGVGKKLAREENRREKKTVITKGGGPLEGKMDVLRQPKLVCPGPKLSDDCSRALCSHSKSTHHLLDYDLISLPIRTKNHKTKAYHSSHWFFINSEPGMGSLSPASHSLSNLGTSNESFIRACATCSQAKAKCVPDQEQNGKCQRYSMH
jgi:hypothetical protein